MHPLAALYGGVVRARNAGYDHGLLRARHLRVPVISVGNLSVGGAGKTPFVILLGELLKRRGFHFDEAAAADGVNLNHLLSALNAFFQDRQPRRIDR